MNNLQNSNLYVKYIPYLFSLLLCLLFASCAVDNSQADTDEQPKNEAKLLSFQEPHRPQFHFSPREKWMNDPNGMVYYEGEYHLFYQFYPDSTVWGPMHWGHAVSEDMVYWEHLPIALYPDSLGWIFSGSAVVDEHNTSGLGKDGKGPLIAIFTYHNSPMEKAGRLDYQYQGIAYSNDRGRTWEKYEGNPVIPNTQSLRDFRDPKVIWDAERGNWLMVFAAGNRMMFWNSPNLTDWTFVSEFGQKFGSHGGVWECPDIFPISVEGTTETKWVLIASINPGGPNGGSATQYFVGDFDGTNFILDPAFEQNVRDGNAIWIDYGRDNYAGVTWANTPNAENYRIFIGWMSNWQYAQEVPTEKWRSAMTTPRKLTLAHTPAGYRLQSSPIKELSKLRTAEISLAGTFDKATLPLEAFIEPSTKSFLSENQGLHELDLSFLIEAPDAGTFGIELINEAGESYRAGYEPATRTFFSDRKSSGDKGFSDVFANKITRGPRIMNTDTVHMQLLIDQASTELFADGGATVITDIYFPGEVFKQVRLFQKKPGDVRLVKGRYFPLKTIWSEAASR